MRDWPVERIRFTMALKERGLADLRKAIADGRGDLRGCCDLIRSFSISSACCSLILAEPDHVVRGWLRQAAEYGVKALEAPPSEGGITFKELKFEVSPDGMREVARREHPARQGPVPLALNVYNEILFEVVAFGEKAGMEMVASFPEAGYRNPDVLAPEVAFTVLRGWKALVLGDAQEAAREASAALKDSSKLGLPGVRALLALATNDEESFQRALSGVLKVHPKLVRGMHRWNAAESVMSDFGMMMSRLALAKGILVEDTEYLPVRFLANHPATLAEQDRPREQA
jgi:hypothetical protein